MYSCSEHDDLIVVGNEISIHMVKYGEVTPRNPEADLDTVKLEETPVLENSEIEFYDWSAHMFYTNIDVKERIKNGRCYVIKADDEPLFVACLNAGASYGCPCPGINRWFIDDMLGIYYFEIYHDENSVVHRKFKQALVNGNLLKNGIALDIFELRRKDATTLLYTFEITNLDTENIYILDPDQMEPEHFSYFTYGVGFEKDGVSYSAKHVSKSPENGIPKDWLYKIEPGESMVRTVEQEGFSAIPLGMVECYFRFPGYGPEGEHWKTEDGRYWLGEIMVRKSIPIQ